MNRRPLYNDDVNATDQFFSTCLYNSYKQDSEHGYRLLGLIKRTAEEQRHIGKRRVLKVSTQLTGH